MTRFISRLAREPLVHFLLIGAALFAAYRLVAPERSEGARIVVTRATVDALAREHAQRWMRPPTGEELAGLVESWVREEMLYREGLAMGLERDDPLIKRRVRQKLEVLLEEQGAGDAPTDDELAAYLARNADRFVRPARLSFEQVFFEGGRPPAETERSLAAARSALERGADPARFGQPTLLPARLDEAPIDLVAREFGAAFARRLEELPLGRWTGPLRSGFGLHLVRVEARAPAAVPALAEIRMPVAREWENERRVAAREAALRALRGRYEVVIEAADPPSAAVSPAPAPAPAPAALARQ